MTNALKAPVPGTDPLASDVAQLVNTFSGLADVGSMVLANPQSTPTAPTVAAGSAGNLNGSYLWVVVLVTGWKQADGSYFVSGFAPSPASTSLSLANQEGNLTAIATGTSVVIGRAIYRTAAGGASGSEKFVGIIWDNTTTTWTDNVADANLGTGMPSSLSTPAAYGTAIPAAVPTSNTTGTTLTGLLATIQGGSGITVTVNGTTDTIAVDSTVARTNAANVFTGMENVTKTQQYTIATDTRTTNLTYTNGQLTTVTEIDPTNGNATVSTTTLTYTNSQLTSVAETAGGNTVTSTLNYTNGQLTSVTKAVQ